MVEVPADLMEEYCAETRCEGACAQLCDQCDALGPLT